jgi:hypothetical protein
MVGLRQQPQRFTSMMESSFPERTKYKAKDQTIDHYSQWYPDENGSIIVDSPVNPPALIMQKITG